VTKAARSSENARSGTHSRLMSHQDVLAFVPPMMPTLVQEPPDGDGWQHEIKHDGYRTQILVQDGEARAITRNGHDWTEKYRLLVEAARLLPCDSAIVEGEVIVQDPNGRSDFHALRSAIAGRPRNLVFMAFDLLHLDGRDLRRLALEERRGKLRGVLGEADPAQPLHFSEELVGSGAEFFAAAERMGLEGIVSKRLGSRYRSGQSKDWLKVKTFAEDDFEVIGTSKGDRAPVALLAREEEGALTYAGGAMITLPQPERDRFWEAIDRIRTSKPPIPMEPRKETGWVKPGLRVRAKFLRGEEMLRHATVSALVELPSAAPKTRSSITPRTAEPPLPNPKLARGDVAAYYEVIAPALLPWVAARPLNMVRCSGSKCWFQRNLNHPATEPGTFGPAIRRISVLQKNGKTEDYLFIEDVEGLRACVAVDAVEFHGWGSLIDDIERPDRLVIDLDPDEGLGFEFVRDAAFEVRDAFDAIGLKSFAMLTGGKGIHVIVPTAPAGQWPAVRAFARSLCGALADADPGRFTVALPKAERRGRIFLDYLRNQRTATAVLPYSARARPGAPVAAPVTWQELPGFESAAAFSIRDRNKLVRRANSRRLHDWGRAGQLLPI
jgi:bifunctional non-homologous end joining protein LigD